MATPSLKGAVGDPGRTDKPVPNRPDDVALVHEMLLANGFALSGTGKVNPLFVKCIKSVQKKIGIRNPDGVVDPGQDTFKALLPQYNKMLADIGAGERVLLKDGSKRILISKADYDRLNAAVLTELKFFVRLLRDEWNACENLRKSWVDSVNGGKGVLTAIGAIVVMSAGEVSGSARLPDMKKWGKALKAINNADAAVKSGNLKKASAAFVAAEKAQSELFKEADRYNREMGRHAKSLGENLQLTTTAGWAVVGLMATPVLVGAGIPVTAATVIGAAGTAYVSAYVDEVGKYLAGSSGGFIDAQINVNVAMVVAAGTAGISKVQLPFVKSVAAKFAGPMSRATLGKIPVGACQKYIQNYLTSAGQTALSTAVTEVVSKSRKRMEKGDKFDYEKEIRESLEKVIRGVVLAPMFDSLGRFTQGFAVRNRDKYVELAIAENKTLTSLIKNNKLNSKELAQLKANVIVQVGTQVVDQVVPQVIDTSTGKESAAQLEKRGAAILKSDRNVQNIIEKAIQRELKRKNIRI